jgi:hypothetical protein
VWYIDAIAWSESYTPEVDAAINGEWGDEWASDDRRDYGCRVHGNPFLNTMSIAWLDSVENRRGELDAKFYGKDGGLFIPLFAQLPGQAKRMESIHIFDPDDAEFEELGEERIHERLTSHMGDVFALPEEERPQDLALDVCKNYVNEIVLSSLADGHVPPTILTEIIRQEMGLPYSWISAEIDD